MNRGVLRKIGRALEAGGLKNAILIASFSVLLAGCHRAPAELLDHPRSFPGVVIKDVNFYSPALARNMPYRAYLPLEAAAGTKMPIVYLLHGCGTSYRDWSNDSDVGAYAASRLILVMADGGGCSYYMNAAFNADERYEDYLVNDLLRDAETRFAVLPGREHRAIVGVSMGGFAAIELALSHPDLFAFAAGISPAIDAASRPDSWRRWSQSMRFRHIFGPRGSELRAHRDPFLLAQSAEPSHTPFLYITAGDQEALLAPIRRFTALLEQRSYAFEFHTRPGGHDWNEWDRQLPGCFESLLAHLHRS